MHEIALTLSSEILDLVLPAAEECHCLISEPEYSLNLSTLFSLSRPHNPLWVCIYSPLAGFSLLCRGF